MEREDQRALLKLVIGKRGIEAYSEAKLCGKRSEISSKPEKCNEFNWVYNDDILEALMNLALKRAEETIQFDYEEYIREVEIDGKSDFNQLVRITATIIKPKEGIALTFSKGGNAFSIKNYLDELSSEIEQISLPREKGDLGKNKVNVLLTPRASSKLINLFLSIREEILIDRPFEENLFGTIRIDDEGNEMTEERKFNNLPYRASNYFERPSKRPSNIFIMNINKNEQDYELVVFDISNISIQNKKLIIYSNFGIAKDKLIMFPEIQFSEIYDANIGLSNLPYMLSSSEFPWIPISITSPYLLLPDSSVKML